MLEEETAESSASSEGSIPESDEPDVIRVNTKDDASTSEDSLQTGRETMEYSHNNPLENEEIVKDNKEITDRHHSDDAIEATHPSHPTQRILDNKHP